MRVQSLHKVSEFAENGIVDRQLVYVYLFKRLLEL